MGHAIAKHNDDGLAPHIKAMLELDAFLASPQSVGLDGLKETLRNFIQLMLEIKGYDTGYDASHFTGSKVSSLSMDGASKHDRLKKKKLQQLIDDMLEIEREMKARFEPLFESVSDFIFDIEHKIQHQIEVIDEKIDEIAMNEEHAKLLKQQSNKRKRLVRFKKHIQEHEEELKDAANTAEILDIKKDLKEDIEDFNNGKSFSSKKKQETIAQTIVTMQEEAIKMMDRDRKERMQREKREKKEAVNTLKEDYFNTHDPASNDEEFREFMDDMDFEFDNGDYEYSHTHTDTSGGDTSGSSSGETGSGSGSQSGESDGKSGDNGEGSQKTDRPDFDLAV